VTASFIKSDMTGRFECIDPDEKNHGPIRARGRRLEYADGTEYHSFGTTCYAWVQQPMALQE
jgi:hypothetical protein